MAFVNLAGQFSGTGVSSSFALSGDFTISLSGFGIATVELQRFIDGEWRVVKSYAANAEENGTEVEKSGRLYRFECTAFTSGPIKYRVES